MVHCDLKPNNILVFPDEGGVLNADRLKIANFGLAKEGKEEMGF
jgi:serine/threonine protein kinase